MTAPAPITLFAFLLHPRQGASRLNGWQRIWVVASAVLFAIHAAVGISIFPPASKMRFEPAPFERKLSELNEWQRVNQSKCRAAGEELEFASRALAESNAKGKARAEAAMADTQAKLKEATAKLFQIETSGGKYYSEWSKYNNAVDAYRERLREQQWTPKAVDPQTMLNDESKKVLARCAAADNARTSLLADIDTAKQDAESAHAQAKDAVVGTVISFLCFSLGIYAIGWCIGWIAGGFKRAA